MSPIRYVVQSGDTIYNIAKANRIEMADIILLNNLKHPDRIYPGQELLLSIEPLAETLPPPLPEPNFTYAKWIYEVYSGKDSELSAVTTYLYQAVVLDRPEFDEILRPIAYDELRHLEQLAWCLRFLGADPRYQYLEQGQWVDWRGRFVHYNTDLCGILDYNMNDEATAARHYTELTQMIPIPEIQRILCQLAADEERHYQCFAQAKQRFCPTGLPAQSAPYPPLAHDQGPLGPSWGPHGTVSPVSDQTMGPLPESPQTLVLPVSEGSPVGGKG